MKTPTTERPILFSTPMVQAILENRKTMTRRTKGIPALTTVNELTHYEYKGTATGLPATHCFARMYRGNWVETIQAFCPYGKPGDKLWVRETWAKVSFPSGTASRSLKTIFKADVESKYDVPASGWKPSIHMPKAAARIWLEIVSVKAERLQDISEADAIAEGVLLLETEEDVQVWCKGKWGDARTLYTYKNYLKNADFSCHYAKDSFTTLWYEINGIQSWLDNPWVWVIEFKRINP